LAQLAQNREGQPKSFADQKVVLFGPPTGDVNALILECRQDSGNEFHLSDKDEADHRQEIDEFFGKNWDKWLGKSQ
jgi:hypothetical protein